MEHGGSGFRLPVLAVYVTCFAMPRLDELSSAALAGKSLVRIGARSAKGLQLLKATEPAKSAFRARRLAARMFDIANDAEVPVADRVAACKAMLAAQDQVLDWLSYPKRPAAGSAGRSAIPIEAIEAILATPPADLPLDP